MFQENTATHPGLLEKLTSHTQLEDVLQSHISNLSPEIAINKIMSTFLSFENNILINLIHTLFESLLERDVDGSAVLDSLFRTLLAKKKLPDIVDAASQLSGSMNTLKVRN